MTISQQKAVNSSNDGPASQVIHEPSQWKLYGTNILGVGKSFVAAVAAVAAVAVAVAVFGNHHHQRQQQQ